MSSPNKISESDALYQFAVDYDHPDPQRLDDFARQFPAYAEALTALAIELVIEHASSSQEEPPTDEATPDASTAATLDRAMSRFQNRLYAVRNDRVTVIASRSRDQSTIQVDPFSSRSSSEMKFIIVKLDVNAVFLMRLRDRGIDENTMSPGFIASVSSVLDSPVDVVRAHFAAPSVIRQRTNFKSELPPVAGEKISFEQAVRTSGLSVEQQLKLLNL